MLSLHDSASSVEDKIYNMFLSENGTEVNIASMLAALHDHGLTHDDPRLNELHRNIQFYQDQQLDANNKDAPVEIGREVFHHIIKDNIEIINRTLAKQLVVPDFKPFTEDLERIYNHCKTNKKGKNANYIPQLERYDPNYWGLSVCTVDGQRFTMGDTDVPFTMQSTSKPFSYAMALSEYGENYVHKHVGREPSGRFFNEISLDNDKKPHNPMINAGAIMTVGILYPELTIGDRFDKICSAFKKAAGGKHLSFNNSVFLSERENADRNFALAYFMRENGVYPEEVAKDKFKESLELYFMICSMEVTVESGAILASTLANGGVCPLTGERVFKADMVKHVLSLMLSCGMYEYSGQFAFHVGVPAKSGVSGALMLVIPNLCGICVWAPPLDCHGNSCRGVQFAEELVKNFNFHNFDCMLFNQGDSKKKDPRKSADEAKGLAVVNLLFAAQSGDITAMRRYHLSDLDMNSADYDGRTALHLASSEGHELVVDYLIKVCKVDPCMKDRWGHTALDDAKQFKHTATEKKLAKYFRRLSMAPEAFEEEEE